MTSEKHGSKGGKARDAKLDSERKRQIARAGAIARWGEKPLRATHKGNFKEDFGIDVECYVLDDEAKTAVISQTGMARALGMSPRGDTFPKFVGNRVMSQYVGDELRAKIQNPIKFQWGSGGAEQPPSDVHGSDVTLLIDVCKAIVRADDEGKLIERQKPFARQAHIILTASAKLGIQQLVYKLSGFDATREQVVAAFKMFVREEAREYEKEFPDQLYAEWYRLYQLPKPERNKPWKFKHLTVDQVYTPLARSSGRILSLTHDKRNASQTRHKKLHQFLSEIGVKALRQQLGQLLGIARISKTKEEYEEFFQRLFGEPDLFR